MLNTTHRTTLAKLHVKPRKLCKLLPLLIVAMLQCSICACNIESDTKIIVTSNSTSPTFTLQGSGNLSRFVVYGPLIGEYASEEDRPVLWKMFPNSNGTSKSVSDLPPIKFAEVPSGWTQYTPKDGKPSPLVDGLTYRVVANVNSANSGYIDITVRDGKVLPIK